MRYFFLTVTTIPIVLLCWIVITSPSPTGFLSRTSLLSVTSKEADPSQPSLWLGMFSSCARQYDNYTIKCNNNFGDPLDFSLRYDLSVLPQGSPDYILQNPPPYFRGMALFNCALVGLLFFLLLLMCALPCYVPRTTYRLAKCLSQIKLFISMGLFLLGGIGLVNSLVLRQFFKQTSDHFNAIVTNYGPNPDLVASLGNCFRYAFTCYVMAIVLALFILVDRAFSYQPPPPSPPPSLQYPHTHTPTHTSTSTHTTTTTTTPAATPTPTPLHAASVPLPPSSSLLVLSEPAPTPETAPQPQPQPTLEPNPALPSQSPSSSQQSFVSFESSAPLSSPNTNAILAEDNGRSAQEGAIEGVAAAHHVEPDAVQVASPPLGTIQGTSAEWANIGV